MVLNPIFCEIHSAVSLLRKCLLLIIIKNVQNTTVGLIVHGGRIKFKGIRWSTDYLSNKTFEAGSVILQNNTNGDVDYIKFKVKLFSIWFREAFFSQTVEYHNKIYQGDIVSINVPGLSNYYAGFDIDRDRISFVPELIEVKPKAQYQDCKIIKDLKSQQTKNSNFY